MNKKLYILLIASLVSAVAFAQTPAKMSYQAVIRNASNLLVSSQAVGMQISILQGSASGAAIYVETHSATTNQNGLVSIEIGNGVTVSGNLSSIDWSTGDYFIKTETDPSGGSVYSISGTSQLLSVPYALHANVADSVSTNFTFTESDPIFSSSVAGSITSADTANWNNPTTTQLDSTDIANFGYVAGPKTIDTQIDSSGIVNLGFVAGPKTVDTDTQLSEAQVDGFVANNGYLTSELDGSVTNEIQALSLSNDTVYLTDGGFVKLPAGFDGDFSNLTNIPTGIADGDDNTQLSEAQVDGFVANNGYLTSELDGSVTNEIQVLSLSNDTVYLTDGGFVKLPAGFDGDFSNLTNIPTGIADGDDNTQLSEAQVDGFVANNGYLTSELDGSVTNEIQALSLSNDTVYLTDGGFVKLPAGFDGDFSNLTNIPTGIADGDDNTQLSEAQVDGFVANNGYLTSEVDGSVTNEIQALSLSNDTVYLTDGGFVKLPAGFDGDFSNLTNIPTGIADGDDNTQLSEAQVDGFVANNGYLTSEVDGSVTNEIELPTGGNNGQLLRTDGSGNYTWVDQTVDTDTDTQLDSSAIAALGFVAGAHSNALVYKGVVRATNESSSNPNVNNEIPNGSNRVVRWLSVKQNYQNSLGGTNNTVITIPAGISFIRINAVITFDQNLTSSGGKAQFSIYKGGNPFSLTNDGFMTFQYFNYLYTHNYNSTLIPVTAGETFDIRLFQNSGSSLYLSWGSISSAISFEFYGN